MLFTTCLRFTLAGGRPVADPLTLSAPALHEEEEILLDAPPPGRNERYWRVVRRVVQPLPGGWRQELTLIPGQKQEP